MIYINMVIHHFQVIETLFVCTLRKLNQDVSCSRSLPRSREDQPLRAKSTTSGRSGYTRKNGQKQEEAGIHAAKIYRKKES